MKNGLGQVVIQFLKTVRTRPTRLDVKAFQSCQVCYDDHRPKVKTFIGLPPGNFETLSRLKDLVLCGLKKKLNDKLTYTIIQF